jgi:tetratricopeptide (TPR) repeat protein
MSMAPQENSVTARLARWALWCAVRHWPEENRAWGLALAAEVDETATAFETVRWSLGGIMLFTRSVLSSAWAWMKLPTGGSLSGGANEPDGPSLLPKRSRVFTAVVLAAAAVLLILPEGREAIRTVRSSWEEHRQSNSDERTLDELGVRAEREKDASTLAFVALRSGDSKRAEDLTERAIALDPQLIWVYGSRSRSWPNSEPPKAQWLARLQAADPDNAVPYLLEAYQAAGPDVGKRYYGHGAPKDTDFDAVESNSKWMELMERAYESPRYDSYFQRHVQLTRRVWNRETNLSPMVVLSGLWYHGIPSLLNLRIFAEVKIHDAQKARAAGDLKRAESLLNQVNTFGVRMTDGSETRIEKLIGWAVSRKADKELAALYSSAGKTEDEHRAMARLNEIDERAKEMQYAHNPAHSATALDFRKMARLVQGFAILCIAGAFAAFVGILMVELWPNRIPKAHAIWRKAACRMADYGPAALLVGSIGFLISFLPFQHAFEEYRALSNGLPNQERLTDAMWGLLEIPEYMTGANASVSTWTIITIALIALLSFVLVRGLFRTRSTVAKPA